MLSSILSTPGRQQKQCALNMLDPLLINNIPLPLIHVDLLLCRPKTIPPEILIISMRLRHNSLMRPPCRQTRAKQPIHLLKRNALGLRHQEEDIDCRNNHHRREKEVHAVVHAVEHLRREAGDDEVPEPIVCGGESLGKGADVLVEHFGVEDPGRSVP